MSCLRSRSRRQHERDDRDAVEQVLTETAFLHFLPQVLFVAVMSRKEE